MTAASDPNRPPGDWRRLGADAVRAITTFANVIRTGFSTRFGKAALAAVGLGVIFAVIVVLEIAGLRAPSPTAAISGRPSDALLARIGERHFYLSDLEALARAKREMDEDERLDPASADAQRLLEEAVDQYLLARRALELGLHDSVDVRVRLQAAQERILASAYLEREVADRVPVDTVRSIYEQQNQLLPLGDEVRASHIVVETRAQADQLVAQLAGGADFGEAARARSIDAPTRGRGGDMGYFTRDMMEPALARAAFSTDVGQVAAPFETQIGWHVLKVDDRREREPPDFESVRGDIEYFLTLEVVRDVIDDLRRGVDVELFSDAVALQVREDPAPLELRTVTDEDDAESPASVEEPGGE